MFKLNGYPWKQSNNDMIGYQKDINGHRIATWTRTDRMAREGVDVSVEKSQQY